MAEENAGSGYGKRPLWQWVLIYIVVGGLIYGAVYYFFLSKNTGYNYSGTSQNSSLYDNSK